MTSQRHTFEQLLLLDPLCEEREGAWRADFTELVKGDRSMAFQTACVWMDRSGFSESSRSDVEAMGDADLIDVAVRIRHLAFNTRVSFGQSPHDAAHEAYENISHALWQLRVVGADAPSELLEAEKCLKALLSMLNRACDHLDE